MTNRDPACTRMIWRDLVDRTLPDAARDRADWPVHLNHCFARILLDNAAGTMWRSVIEPPAWRNAPEDVLQKAIDLGQAILDDKADLWVLNNASLKMRGKALRKRIIKKPATR